MISGLEKIDSQNLYSAV